MRKRKPAPTTWRSGEFRGNDKTAQSRHYDPRINPRALNNRDRSRGSVRAGSLKLLFCVLRCGLLFLLPSPSLPPSVCRWYPKVVSNFPYVGPRSLLFLLLYLYHSRCLYFYLSTYQSSHPSICLFLFFFTSFRELFSLILRGLFFKP